MKVGDRVQLVNPPTMLEGVVGKIIDTDTHFEYGKCEKNLTHKVEFEKDGVFIVRYHTEKQLRLVPKNEKKKVHLELTAEEWKALADLLKMKDNLELLERLLKRAKGETND